MSSEGESSTTPTAAASKPVKLSVVEKEHHRSKLERKKWARKIFDRTASNTKNLTPLLLSSSFLLSFQLKSAPAINGVYRRAILQAIESLHDFQSRSNIDLVRKHTQAILSEPTTMTTNDQQQTTTTWNDKLFLKTLKSIVSSGDVDLFGLQAELSPTYKRKRADSLLSRMQAEINSSSEAVIELPVLPHPEIAQEHPAKAAPKRRSEHEKWKIMPKKVYDKTT